MINQEFRGRVNRLLDAIVQAIFISNPQEFRRIAVEILNRLNVCGNIFAATKSHSWIDIFLEELSKEFIPSLREDFKKVAKQIIRDQNFDLDTFTIPNQLTAKQYSDLYIILKRLREMLVEGSLLLSVANRGKIYLSDNGNIHIVVTDKSLKFWEINEQDAIHLRDQLLRVYPLSSQSKD